MIRIAKIEDGEFSVKKIKGDLESLQKEVGGSGVITLCPYYTELDERGIDIYADDNGLLVEHPRISIIVKMNEKTGEIEHGIFGNVVFIGHDGEGGSASLTDAQLAYIKKHLKFAVYATYGDYRKVRTKCYKFEFNDVDAEIMNKMKTGGWK